MDTINNLEQNTNVLEVTENTKKYLKTMASWTTFMAVLGFISIAFLVLASIIMLVMGKKSIGSAAIPFQGFYSFMGLFYIVFAVMYIFPNLFLLRFSQKTKNALVNQDTNGLEEGVKNMKSYWKFMGIMIIVMIAMMIIAMPIIIIATTAMAL